MDVLERRCGEDGGEELRERFVGVDMIICFVEESMNDWGKCLRSG